VGLPLPADLPTDVVIGDLGRRSIARAGGLTVEQYSRQAQVSNDAAAANASGWNCRVHAEYEASPAVDWYVPPGTPVYATMDGTATLLINTTANAFDHYFVDREPYLGDPDRSRAPLNPFPGPGGGMGVYVSVINDEFRTDYGHLDLAATIADVAAQSFSAPYSGKYDYGTMFTAPQPITYAAQIASWPVERGELIGYTGDAGYSEAPHLHYQITRRSDGAKLCPTQEGGFADGGWLFG
jgi:murein DD-endopeptidase MepM/ murein hydrolase activator NlpD